jgi:hypothetical protein
MEAVGGMKRGWNNGQAACGGGGDEVLTTDERQNSAVLNGAPGETMRGTGWPVRRSARRGDLANAFAESLPRTDLGSQVILRVGSLLTIPADRHIGRSRSVSYQWFKST